MSKMLFHEIPSDKYDDLILARTTWGEIMEKFLQPDWCGYPNALEGMMGCWSLVGRKVTGEDYCKNCECYIKKSGQP